MGLFSSKKKIHVSSAAMHLMDSSGDPLVDAVISAIMEGSSIPSKLVQTILNGSAIQMKRVIRYAEEHYTLGLPAGQSNATYSVKDSTIETIITRALDLEFGCLVDLSFTVEGSSALGLLPVLVSLREYDEQSGLVNNPPVAWIWPEPVYIGSPFAPSYLTAGARKVLIKDVEDVPGGLSAIITYQLMEHQVHPRICMFGCSGPTQYELVWVEVDTFSEELTIPNPTFDGVMYVVAKYQELNEDSVVPPGAPILWWFYDTTENLHEELSSDPVDYPEDKYLPVVPMRYYNQDLCDEAHQETELYKTSKKMLKKLNIRIDQLADLINENPDVGAMDHAYVMWGINLQTDNGYALWYLGLLLDHMGDIAEINDPDSEDQNGYDFNPLNEGTSGSSLTMVEHGLNVRIFYKSITSENFIGKLCKKGTAEKEIIDGVLYIRMQLTNKMYKEIVCHGLGHVNLVYRGKGVGTTPAMVTADEDENNFIFPLNVNIANQMGVWHRSLMFNDASLMVINTYEVTKVKWYERGWFKIVLYIVAIVVAIWTAQYWLIGLVTAAEAGVMAVILYLLEAVLVSMAINFAADWLVEEFGAKLGIFAAILMIAVSVFTPGSSFSILGTVMATSQMLMQVSTALISAANEWILEEADKVRNEYADLYGELKDRYEELETAEQDMLGSRSDILDPLMFTRPPRFKMVPVESPDAMIQRCLGLPENNASMSHDVIPGFHTAAVRLNLNMSMDMYNQNMR